MKPKTTTNRDTLDVPAFTQDEVKNEGKVYTPTVVVEDMIKRFIYFTDHTRAVCDPSCGQGNFLRYIFTERLAISGLTPNEVFDNIYGLELDSDAVTNARVWFVDHGVSPALADQHIVQGNALVTYKKFIGCMDDIVGNPPYVRGFNDFPEDIHLRDNLADAFFQIGMTMLKEGPGHNLVYITQDSFFTNEHSTLRTFLTSYNIKVAEHHLKYSKAFRKHDIAVDIGLIEVATGEQQPMVQTSRHVPFMTSAARVGTERWLLYPESIHQLYADIQPDSYVRLTDVASVTKGRTCNRHTGVPGSYSSVNYGKVPTSERIVPVLSDVNTDYFFPLDLDPHKYAKATDKRSTEQFEPFIILPYFTSRFRFCVVEEDILTTPLLYIINSRTPLALLPLLNSSVTDFVIRYVTKSRDTGYEFKKNTFGQIKFPPLTDELIQTLTTITELVRAKEITVEDADKHVCSTVYMLSDDQYDMIQECKKFWFKKNVNTLLSDVDFMNSLLLR